MTSQQAPRFSHSIAVVELGSTKKAATGDGNGGSDIVCMYLFFGK